MEDAPLEISEFEAELLTALVTIANKYGPASEGGVVVPIQQGWMTSARVREHLGKRSLETRKSLKRMASLGYVDLSTINGVDSFRINARGTEALLRRKGEGLAVKAQTWTGLVSPIQIAQILNIVSEIEDICEGIQDNELRSQIYGLIRALQALLEVPNPPKVGLLALIGDPAFANIVQIATCLAAIVAALKA